MHPLHLCCIQPFLQSLVQILPFLVIGLIAARRIMGSLFTSTSIIKTIRQDEELARSLRANNNAESRPPAKELIKL
jgi:hypothetical protein